MSLATLLTSPTDAYSAGTFAFEHRMAHRNLTLSMAPLDRFSVAPYFFDPQMDTGGWLMNHQQAHNDFQVNLPVFWGWWYVGTQQYGVASTQNLMDTVPGQTIWWTWANHMEHRVAQDLLPLDTQLAFPS